MVDHAAIEHQERDLRDALADPDRHRLLRCDVPPGRGAFKGIAPTHTYDLSQQTLAGYWQQTLGLLPTTDFSYGARIQNTSLSARDRFHANAPGCAMFFTCSDQASPLDSNETQYALHIGLEHRFNNVFSVFGRAARAFRTPTVDERVSRVRPSTASFFRIPGDFKLKTQTSHDVEGGFRIKSRRLPDAIEHLHHGPRERDPFQSRRCSSTSTSIRPAATARRPARRCVSATAVTLRGGMAYTRAVFREGPFAGNDVPLVSRYTARAA